MSESLNVAKVIRKDPKNQHRTDVSALELPRYPGASRLRGQAHSKAANIDSCLEYF